ncbi:hypothetical protein Q0M94_05550 [Deinococcus radiomollis]|uniref:hypothetical protein n=1 Tax=Deinococcus radiomollis TaxID=468916 RepID=UPI0038929F9A
MTHKDLITSIEKLLKFYFLCKIAGRFKVNANENETIDFNGNFFIDSRDILSGFYNIKEVNHAISMYSLEELDYLVFLRLISIIESRIGGHLERVSIAFEKTRGVSVMSRIEG